MIQLKNIKQKYASLLFILWAGGAALLSYSLVYALRKPFTSASFNEMEVFGMEYKVVVIIIQIIGYVVAKFIGIKLISELKKENKLKFIFSSVLLAEISLLFFALLPTPYNLIPMFFNGLSLGCMWGIIFSFLEGRKVTDILASLLGASQIISSGAAKSLGLYVMQTFHIDQFWMPALIGACAMPILLLLGYSLTRLPQPNAEDILLKSKRKTLNGKERKEIFFMYMPLLIMLFTANSLLVIVRNIKEDFLVDIINVSQYNSWLFTVIDAIIVAIILTIIGLMVWVKNNLYAIHILLTLIIIVTSGMIFISFNYQSISLDPIAWLFFQSLCLYISYQIFQTIFFDRFIACFKINGNVGFFIAINDFVGYAGAVCVLFLKELFNPAVNWTSFYNWISGSVGIICLIFYIFSFIYIHQRYKKENKQKAENENNAIEIPDHSILSVG